MKSLNKILPLAFLCLGLSSCLDEEDPLTSRDTETSPNLIEFYSEDPAEHPSAERIYTEVTKTFDIVPEETFDVTISYSGKDNAPEDIVVGIKVDEAALQAFNAKLIADAREAAMAGIEDAEEAEEAADEAEAAVEIYDLMSVELYSFPNEITIKKGERRAVLPVTVRPSLFNFAFKYGLPLTISSASHGVISGNFSTTIYSIGAKNQYDGNYTVTATAPMVDVTSAALTGFYPLDADLVTTGPRSVKMFTHTYLGGLEGHPIKSGTANSYYGSFGPVFNMDEEGNVISVTNFYGQPAANGRAARLNPSGVNKFTINADGSKTLEVSYIMVQAGSDRTFFHEKWTFEGTR